MTMQTNLNPWYTARDAAEEAQARGDLCKTFDYALPQPWVDAVHEATGVWPQTLGFVWAYPEEGRGRVWGLPFPLTAAARDLLATLPDDLR